RLQVHATSTTNSVDRLEKAGLVARRSHPDDRRTTLVDLTEAGRELAAEATTALNAEVFTSPDFSETDLGSLLPHLESLRSGLDDRSRIGNALHPIRLGPAAAEISWTSKYSGRIVESVTQFTSDHWRNHVPQHSSCPALRTHRRTADRLRNGP